MERFRDKNHFSYKPELHLVYKGLEITITAGFMTREQAEAMVRRWETEDKLNDQKSQPLTTEQLQQKLQTGHFVEQEQDPTIFYHPPNSEEVLGQEF